MLISCKTPYKGSEDNHSYYSYLYVVVDTDDFVAEPYDESTDGLLKACGLRLASIDLSTYINRMTSPFMSEDFCFKVFGKADDAHIWYKGFYYHIEDNGKVIKINDFRCVYSRSNGTVLYREICFLGKLGNLLRLSLDQMTFVDFHEDSACLHDIFNYKEYSGLKGIKMSKDAFLRKLLTH